LELELQEGIVPHIFGVHAFRFAIFACDNQICVKLVAVAAGDRVVCIGSWERRLKVLAPLRRVQREGRPVASTKGAWLHRLA